MKPEPPKEEPVLTAVSASPSVSPAVDVVDANDKEANESLKASHRRLLVEGEVGKVETDTIGLGAAVLAIRESSTSLAFLPPTAVRANAHVLSLRRFNNRAKKSVNHLAYRLFAHAYNDLGLAQAKANQFRSRALLLGPVVEAPEDIDDTQEVAKGDLLTTDKDKEGAGTEEKDEDEPAAREVTDPCSFKDDRYEVTTDGDHEVGSAIECSCHDHLCSLLCLLLG
jgi:hypothetical protein